MSVSPYSLYVGKWCPSPWQPPGSTLALVERKSQWSQVGSEVSAYPTLAESDVPPSLPHRAETAATHAAQNFLVPISLHLREIEETQGVREGGNVQERMLMPKKGSAFYLRDTLNYHRRVGA